MLRRLFAVTPVIIFFASTIASGQSIVPIAGYVPIGDGQPATSVVLPEPRGIAVDAQNNVFVVDPSRKRIRRIDAATGLITTAAGGGSDRSDGVFATDAELVDVWDLVLSSDGNLLFADAAIGPVRAVDLQTGRVRTVAGNRRSSGIGDGGSAVDATLSGPIALAIDLRGNLYIGEVYESRVRMVDDAVGFRKAFAKVGEITRHSHSSGRRPGYLPSTAHSRRGRRAGAWSKRPGWFSSRAG